MNSKILLVSQAPVNVDTLKQQQFRAADNAVGAGNENLEISITAAGVKKYRYSVNGRFIFKGIIIENQCQGWN